MTISNLQKNCLTINFSNVLLPPWIMLNLKSSVSPLPTCGQFNVGALSRKKNNINNLSSSMLPKGKFLKVLTLNIMFFFPLSQNFK